jgi:muramoyltetrapeptide carboxypeptidase LdcA involved in peptidoglycan recycling
MESLSHAGSGTLGDVPPDRVVPPPIEPGGKVAVMSPSWAVPEEYPAIHEQALQRLRDVLGVEPVEYASTRRSASPRERAQDLMAAFADPDVGAILATIGGDDQITVLRHLDPQVVVEHPTRFLGYSDNTNLLNWLWFHGVAGFHGGSTQVYLGPGPVVHPDHLTSLRAALFGGEVEVFEAAEFSEDEVAWGLPRALTDAPRVRPAPPWSWYHADQAVTGPTWGGNLEILGWTLAVGRWVRPVDAYRGCVLLLETSEERPSATEVHRTLRNMGERGLLEQAAAVVVARARASGHADPVTGRRGPSDEERDRYRADQEDAVLRALDRYAPGVPVCVGVDFGHTTPQRVLPYGGSLTVDGPGRRLVARYGA